MADGSLSQEDIDALLNSGFGGGDGGGGNAGGGSAGGTDDIFADLGIDTSGGDGGPSAAAIASALGTGFTPPPTSKPQGSKMGGTMSAGTSNLNLLMDVTMSLTVELGRTNMYIKDVLQLSEGAVIELDKNVGEELDLLANGKLIGRGKIIILDDYYGVQVTHIIDPMERLSMG